MREELELTRRNVTPAQFAAYVREQIRKHNITSVCAEDIDIRYWAAGNDLNFNIKYEADGPCKMESSTSKPYDRQTYILDWDDSVFNEIMEFQFWDGKVGFGYYYLLNDNKQG